MVPTGCVSLSDALSSRSSRPPGPSAIASSSSSPLRTGLMPLMCDEMGSTLSSSSTTRHEAHEASERMNRSLKRGVTSTCASVRKRACASMLIAYSWRSEVMLLRRSTTRPPPSTVSMVRASTLGVTASKSCSTSMPKVLPSTRAVSL